MAKTIMDVMARTVNAFGPDPALRYKAGSEWQQLSWSEYSEQSKDVAAALIELGLLAQDKVVILSQNNYRWVIANVGSIFGGCVPAGAYPTSSADQVEYILDHCGAKVVFVENQEQLEKIQSIWANLPNLVAAVVFDDSASDGKVLSWSRFLKLASESSRSKVADRMAAQQPDDVSTIIYTSGTTAKPKAVQLSHGNLTWTTAKAVELEYELTNKDTMLSYLPLSHIAEQLLSIHGPMQAGCCVSFAESFDKLPENLKEVAPTVFLGVPRVWEKIQDRMITIGAQKPPLVRRISAWAKKVGLDYKLAHSPGLFLSVQYWFAKKLFRSVKKALGLHNCRLQITGAAPIRRDTVDYFLSLDLPLYEVYGMSESTGPITMSLPSHYKPGATGRKVPGTELKISDDGEVLTRGPHVFKGYLHNEEATSEAVDSDGWLHTGDLGSIDKEGYLTITGRKKNLIITSGGENIAPEALEEKFGKIRQVEHVVVIGDSRRYLTMLMTLNPELVVETSEKLGVEAKTVQELASCRQLYEYMEAQVREINQTVARVQTIKKFQILGQNFSEEAGELTPTMKIKRAVIAQRYASNIEQMYS